LTILFFLALLLSACGGTETTSNSSTAVNDTGSSTEDAGAGRDIPFQQLTIGTASAGGAFYPIGTGIAEVITQHVDALNVTAEVTGGSVENPRLVGNNESDLGIANADHANFAVAGTDPYDQPYNVEAICSLHASILHIVTTEDSGITSIEDLKGQKVAVGPAGGGSIPMMTAVLKAYGMTVDNIAPIYLSYEDSISQLTDGQVKAALVGSGYPAASVMAMAATDKVVMLSIDDDKMEVISADNPFYSKVLVSKDVYGTENDVTVFGVRNLIVCRPDLSEDTVYAITKALYENPDELKSYHNALESVEQSTMADTAGVKVHPGAEKFYKEAGAIQYDTGQTQS
jgi:TRAP transporter TAXI family solute receptor